MPLDVSIWSALVLSVLIVLGSVIYTLVRGKLDVESNKDGK